MEFMETIEARLSESDLLKMGTTDTEENRKIPLIIYIPGRNQKEERYTIGGLIDVAPTISNIMGIDISDRYFLGRDLADSGNSFVIFRDGSYISRDDSVDINYAQRDLRLSDIILEGDVIPSIRGVDACH
jgi:phosphoglycerol transferase MdoB-like AlkP superfamily enzyme